MSADTEFVPVFSSCQLMTKSGEMIMYTAMVSPSARPRPSMVPPMIPPFPNGITTVRIIPQRVDPSARAPSRSPVVPGEYALRRPERPLRSRCAQHGGLGRHDHQADDDARDERSGG